MSSTQSQTLRSTTHIYMRNIMKSILSITALVVSLTSTPLFASTPSTFTGKTNTKTGIGFGTGSLVGGLVAGPVGIVTGAFIGSLIGQNAASENNAKHLSSSNNELEIRLHEASNKLQVLEEDNSKKSQVLNDAHRAIETLLTQNQELRNHTLNFDVQFRTNSIKIEKQYQQYLSDLANALNTTPNMEIEVAGFADRMGDENYNMQLSSQRAKQVKEYLIKQGIEEERITTLAHGETQPLHPDESLENNFFDRRVTIFIMPVEISSKNIAEEIAAAEEKLSVATKQQ